MKNTIIASSLVALVAIASGYTLSQRRVSAATASQSQAAVSPTVSTSPETPTATDIDNIQDEGGAQNRQDAVNEASGTETNDAAADAPDQKTEAQGKDTPENSHDVPDAQ